MRKHTLLLLLLVSLVFTASSQEDTSLQQYTGKYKFPEGSVVPDVTVTLDKGTLQAVSPMGSSELRRSKGDVFDIVAYSGTATFKRTEGKVSGVEMVVGDIYLDGTRTEDAMAGLLPVFIYPGFLISSPVTYVRVK